MAPFLGEDLPGEIAAAGGLKQWQPPDVLPEPDDVRRCFVRIWSQLHDCALAPESALPLWLGHGDQDYLREVAQLLGPCLPEGRYQVRLGGHLWKVWQPLFAELLPAVLAPAGR